MKIKGKKNATDPEIFKILPGMICMFARQARNGSGYRLLSRAVRHGMDPMCPDIFLSKCKIIKFRNKVGLVMEHCIKASMKPDTYNVQVAFTKENIITCSCTCKAGAWDDERVLCVHILPVLFLLSQEMFKNLSEHILYEWADFVSQNDNRNIMKESEIEALGCCIRTLLPLENNTCCYAPKSTFEMLNEFSVGTEKRKDVRPLRANSMIYEHRPLREVDFTSTVTQAMRVISSNEANIEMLVQDDELENNDNNNITTSTYQNIVLACAALSKILRKQSNCSTWNSIIGFNILSSRSEYDFDRIEKQPVSQHVRKQFKTMCNMANNIYRSGNQKQSRNVELTITNQEYLFNTSINYLDGKIDVPINNIGKEVSKSKRMSCCVCKRTNSVDVDAVFTRIPTLRRAKLQPNTKDHIRQTYYKNQHRRNVYLERFGLKSKKEKKYLVYCDNHKIVKEIFNNVPWVDKNGTKKTLNNIKIVVPKPFDERELNVCTRSQSNIRVPVSILLRKRKPT